MRHHTALILFFATTGPLLSALLSGCLLGGTSFIDKGPEDLPILWQAAGDDPLIRKGFNLVVRDQAGLSQIPLREVQVDFATQMVLIAALGPVKNSAIDIRIYRVWREGSRIRTDILVRRSADAQTEGRQLFHPYHIVVVPKSDLNVADFTTSVPTGALSRG